MLPKLCSTLSSASIVHVGAHTPCTKGNVIEFCAIENDLASAHGKVSTMIKKMTATGHHDDLTGEHAHRVSRPGKVELPTERPQARLGIPDFGRI